MASAQKRPNRTWQGIARCDGTCEQAQTYGHCKGHKKGLSGHSTKKAALAAAHAVEAQLKLHGGNPPGNDKLTLGELALLWFDSDRDVKESTDQWYRSMWSAWVAKDPKLAFTPIAAITPHQVDRWLRFLRDSGLMKSPLRQYLVLLRSILGYAIHPMQILDVNPCANVDLPKSRKAPVHDHGRFTVPELLAIADAIDPRYRMLVILSGFYGGYRFAEMAGLRAANVTITGDGAIVNITEQYSGGKWSTPKNEASIREVFIPPPHSDELAEHLQTYRASETRDGTVFSSPTGAPLNYNNYLNRVWHPTLETLGLKSHGTHALRRSFVDICYDAKIAPEVVADIGGWKDVGVITNIYRGKSTPAKIAETAKMINAATSVYFEPDPSGNGGAPSLIIASGQHSDGRIDHLAVLPPDYTGAEFNAAFNSN